MSSRQEQEAAGPSGLEEELGDNEEDEICQEALDRFEPQRAFQTHLLQQSGGGLDASAEGAFEFKVGNYVNRISPRMGVRERHFNTRLHQRGNLIPDQNITEALQDALRRAVNQVLATTLTSKIKIASTSLSVPIDYIITSRAGDYVLVNGVKAGTVWRPCSTV